MKLLLDTCAFLWWISDERRVPRTVLRRLQREDQEVLLSVSSAWELGIKAKLGKLVLPSAPLAFVNEATELYRVSILAIDLADATAAGELPLHHKDPFDRLLIAQALLRGIRIVTPDEAFRPYGVPTLW